MKKLLSCLMVVLALGACNKSEDSKTFEGNEYKLENAMNDANITIGFDGKEKRFYGKVVNRYFGTYTLEGDNFSLSRVGSTMMMGPEELMKAEFEYIQDLGKVNGYKVDGKTLTLTTTDGKNLVFKKIGKIEEEKK